MHGVVPYAQALNSSGFDNIGMALAAQKFAEAAYALTTVVENYRATPELVRNLVNVLANEAQACAFAGVYGWTDLAAALDASEAAVHWQRELLEHAQDPASEAPAEAVERESAELAGVLLTFARVQAACALLEETHATYGEAARLLESGSTRREQWREVAASVASEIGVVEPSSPDYVESQGRVTQWFSLRQ